MKVENIAGAAHKPKPLLIKEHNLNLKKIKMRYFIILLHCIVLNNFFAQNFIVADALILEQREELSDINNSDHVTLSVMLKMDSLRLMINNSSDTIWVFSTPFLDKALLYSSTTLAYKRNSAKLNFKYSIPHRESYYSGLNQYQFIKILPFQRYSICINFRRLVEISDKVKQTDMIKNVCVTMFYFENVESMSRKRNSSEQVIKFDEDNFKQIEAIYIK